MSSSVYTDDHEFEQERAERTEALADERDRDAARYPAPPPPMTLQRIVHAQFMAFTLEFALAQTYMKEGCYDAIDLDALTLKCEAFADSLALMQAERTTALAAD